jgi:UDP-N-acetylglucosamine 2-epimerase
LAPQGYVLATVHRPYNTDVPDNLRSIFAAFGDIYRQSGRPVVLPLHPRTHRQMDALALEPPAGIRLIDPVGYLDMLALQQAAHLILTDSGGVQKEAYTFAVPCITLRPETEWVETVQTGWNVIVGADHRNWLGRRLGAIPDPGSPVQRIGEGPARAALADPYAYAQHARKPDSLPDSRSL